MNIPPFIDAISKEQRVIEARCTEIDGTMQALEEERRALEERNEALDSVKAIYTSSQQVVEDAHATQARLNMQERAPAAQAAE